MSQKCFPEAEKKKTKVKTVNYYAGRLFMIFRGEEHREDTMKMKLGTC